MAFGLVVWLVGGRFAPPVRLVIAGDGFFAFYLVSMAMLTPRGTPAFLRRRSSYADEGIHLIVVITLAAISLSLGAIFYVLNAGPAPGRLELVVAIASVPLGWLTLHAVAALHYAHLYYSSADEDGGARRDAGGLAFPGDDEPALWDFLYYSFVVGMTSQVSDVQAVGSAMRWITLVHGVTSFFINTVLVALAVNAAASFWR